MVPAPFRVVLDANVLFPFTVRDTLLRAAALGMYQVHWSEDILDELIQRQAAALNRPPVTLDDLLTGLGKTVPRFESAVRALLDPDDEEVGRC